LGLRVLGEAAGLQRGGRAKQQVAGAVRGLEARVAVEAGPGAEHRGVQQHNKLDRGTFWVRKVFFFDKSCAQT
jgi:hypothetical protein